MREAHAHLPALGQSLNMLRLEGHTSRASVLQAVASAAAALDATHPPTHPPTHWLLAGGLRVEGFTDDPSPPLWPTRYQLDAVTSRPCCLMSFDHHSAVANTPALALAGFTPTHPDPPGGMLIRDAASGLANGVLLESAAYTLWNAAPQPAPHLRQSLIIAALEHLRDLGFSCVHDLLSPPWLGPLLAQLADEHRLPLAVWLYAPLAELNHQLSAAQAWQRKGLLTFAGAKVFADGTLNAGTAWMLEPYAHPLPHLPRGSMLLSRDDLAHAMRACRSHHVGLAVHAIGDAAVRASLDAWNDLRHELPPPFLAGQPPPLRIEHCELIDAADIPRFAEQRIVASLQPCHLLADMEVLKRQLPHRLNRVLPIHDLIAQGCTPGDLLWFGSDVPIVRANPNDSIIAATLRRRPDLPPSAMIAPEQAISSQECLAAFAYNSP